MNRELINWSCPRTVLGQLGFQEKMYYKEKKRGDKTPLLAPYLLILICRDKEYSQTLLQPPFLARPELPLASLHY